MTGEEKEMQTYIKSIERRLNLPKEVRSRVMSDFVSSIEERREAGQTDEAIRAELGAPKQVAAELNEQMKEFSYRKSPWRFACIALAVLSAGWLIAYRVLLSFGMLLDTFTMTFSPNPSASIGIIGGADGPTSIFVATQTAGFDWDIAIVAAVLILSILGYLRLRKCKQK